MSWFEALILGVIQGLTEFFPVSSSGHLEIGSILLNVESTDNLLFAVVVHLATALATLFVFKKDIGMLISDILKFEWNESTQYTLKIMISMLPVFIVGILFKDQIESLFTGNIILVGSMLLITGGLLLVSHFKKEGTKSIGYINALVIGLAQAFAIIPGISRSGSTIATALILGIERSKAAKFSFLMVLIPIIGATILQMNDYMNESSKQPIAISSLLIGFLAALFSGFIACKWMLKIIKKGKLTHFAIYCFIIGISAILAT